MSWSNTYVGIPFADLGRTRQGCDCWGLLRLVYDHECGIQLPSYSGAYTCAEERAEIARLIEDAQSSAIWAPVSGRINPFDALVFRRGRLQSHVGVAVDHRQMLHMVDEDQAKIEDVTQSHHAARFIGAFRHANIGAKRGVAP